MEEIKIIMNLISSLEKKVPNDAEFGESVRKIIRENKILNKNN